MSIVRPQCSGKIFDGCLQAAVKVWAEAECIGDQFFVPDHPGFDALFDVRTFQRGTAHGADVFGTVSAVHFFGSYLFLSDFHGLISFLSAFGQ